MQIIRSSYGLFGIVYEVTIKVRPTTALAVRHYSLSLDNFRRYFPIYKARGYAVMYYIFPYVKRVLVELRKDNPEAQPKSRHRWVYRNRFWRKYGPAVTLWIQRSTKNPRLRSLADKLHFFVLRQALVLVVRSDRTWPHAQIINYPRDPGANKYLFSMWAFREGGFFDILDEYCNFCLAYEKATGYRCNLPSVGYAITRDVEALLSYSWEGATLSIDPASTGGPEWEEFLRHYNEFCSERRGVPLFNQTPFLTREQVRKAFGVQDPAIRRAPQSGRPQEPHARHLFPRAAAASSGLLGEPADQREGDCARQRAHRLQEALDLRRKGDLVRLAAELLQDLPRAALLAHDVELLLRDRRTALSGVSTKPGLMMVTATPVPSSSSLRLSARLITAALLAP